MILQILPVFAASIELVPAAEFNQSQVEGSDMLSPPRTSKPVVVTANFYLQKIGGIDDEAETFSFTGLLATQWLDPRQAFDPTEAGCNEKVYQGDYQFNELSPCWYPQVVLVNESGMYDRKAVALRVKPDGQSILIEKIEAVAETELNLIPFPFDNQELVAKFEILGFDATEVRFTTSTNTLCHDQISVPQWSLAAARLEATEAPKAFAGVMSQSSQFVMRLDVSRDPLFMLRLVIAPLALIVVLSWSVFWMDRSSIGDRINVSFIGILTVVAYQIVVSDIMPRISYITWMNAFLNVSFCVLCLTVVVNLLVSEADKRGDLSKGDYIDRRCRWLFPLAYFGLLAVTVPIAYALNLLR